MVWFILLWIFVLIFAGPIVQALNQSSEKKKKQQEAEMIHNTQFDTALRVWNRRVIELGIDTSSSIVYRKYANDYSFYPLLCWKDSDSLNFFYAKPTTETGHLGEYQYPENLNVMCIYDCNILYYYRTGSQGNRIHTDFSRSDALMDMSNRTTGLNSYMYAKKALEAAQEAETHIEITDDRKTVIELTDGTTLDFRIDAFELFKRLIPEKCR